MDRLGKQRPDGFTADILAKQDAFVGGVASITSVGGDDIALSLEQDVLVVGVNLSDVAEFNLTDSNGRLSSKATVDPGGTATSYTCDFGDLRADGLKYGAATYNAENISAVVLATRPITIEPKAGWDRSDYDNIPPIDPDNNIPSLVGDQIAFESTATGGKAVTIDSSGNVFVAGGANGDQFDYAIYDQIGETWDVEKTFAYTLAAPAITEVIPAAPVEAQTGVVIRGTDFRTPQPSAAYKGLTLTVTGYSEGTGPGGEDELTVTWPQAAVPGGTIRFNTSYDLVVTRDDLVASSPVTVQTSVQSTYDFYVVQTNTTGEDGWHDLDTDIEFGVDEHYGIGTAVPTPQVDIFDTGHGNNIPTGWQYTRILFDVSLGVWSNQVVEPFQVGTAVNVNVRQLSETDNFASSIVNKAKDIPVRQMQGLDTLNPVSVEFGADKVVSARPMIESDTFGPVGVEKDRFVTARQSREEEEFNQVQVGLGKVVGARQMAETDNFGNVTLLVSTIVDVDQMQETESFSSITVNKTPFLEVVRRGNRRLVQYRNMKRTG